MAATARDIEARGSRTLTFQADVSDFTRAHAIVEQINAKWGRLDVLLNNAGAPNPKPILEISEALLQALARSGRRGQDLLVAFRSVQALTMGFVQVELAGALSRAAGERPQTVIKRFRSLPAERYPHLIEIATAAVRSKGEDELRAGLDLLLASLASPAADKIHRSTQRPRR